MPKIFYAGQYVYINPHESVLQVLTRHGFVLRSSCRGGSCQTCLMECFSGDIPIRAQTGLSPQQIRQNYFLPCICVPISDMAIGGTHPVQNETLTSANQTHHHPNRPKDPPTDLELWDALQKDDLLNLILRDFYARVYADAQMSPFFAGFTQQRLIEKQYSFMHQTMTGKKVYFGNRPRNTHHWMVISEALFAHREQLMLAAMRTHGLAEKWIARWLAIENYYRPDIVKAVAIPRQANGIDLPLEGFEEMVIEVGSICDGCQGLIEVGESVRYHVRRGTVFCARCALIST